MHAYLEHALKLRFVEILDDRQKKLVDITTLIQQARFPYRADVVRDQRIHASNSMIEVKSSLSAI